jgi:hypothetical protein
MTITQGVRSQISLLAFADSTDMTTVAVRPRSKGGNLPADFYFCETEEKLVKTSLKIYVAAILATASLAYAQAQDTATTPAATTPSTTPAATTPSTTPATTTPSTTPAATTPSTNGNASSRGQMQDGAPASGVSGTTENGDDNMAEDGTSLAPRGDRN